MKQVFGEEPANVVLQHAKRSYSLKGEKTPKRVEVFADELPKMLGSGAVLIENLALKSLYSKLELKFKEKKGYRFPDYIKELRESAVTKA